jgi:hypothetical protein
VQPRCPAMTMQPRAAHRRSAPDWPDNRAGVHAGHRLHGPGPGRRPGGLRHRPRHHSAPGRRDVYVTGAGLHAGVDPNLLVARHGGFRHRSAASSGPAGPSIARLFATLSAGAGPPGSAPAADAPGARPLWRLAALPMPALQAGCGALPLWASWPHFRCGRRSAGRPAVQSSGA